MLDSMVTPALATGARVLCPIVLPQVALLVLLAAPAPAGVVAPDLGTRIADGLNRRQRLFVRHRLESRRTRPREIRSDRGRWPVQSVEMVLVLMTVVFEPVA